MFSDFIQGAAPPQVQDTMMQFAALFNVDFFSCAIIGAFVALLNAVLKQHLPKYTGSMILIWTAVSSLAFNLMLAISLQPALIDTWVGVVVGSVISWIIPVGGWSLAKQLARKVGPKEKV